MDHALQARLQPVRDQLHHQEPGDEHGDLQPGGRRVQEIADRLAGGQEVQQLLHG
jgi:hypothetical protein